MRTCLLGLIAIAGCNSNAPAPAQAVAATKLDIPGIENVYRVTPTLFSGGAPEGDAAFDELKKLGITTVISVDGASADVESAKRHGMKYVHLPIGYDGIKTPTAYKLAKAVQASSGPVFLHCHHGKHRGPTAIAVVRLCLEPDYTPADATAWMMLAGTDEQYKGLFRMPTLLVRPSAEQLAALPSEFPAKAEVMDLTKAMVQVDEHWETIKASKGKDWLGADSAATLLAEDYREAIRTLASTKGDDFTRRLIEAETTVTEFAQKVKTNQLKEAAELFAKAQSQCTQCHAKFRD